MNATIASPVFELFVNQYERDLQKRCDYSFETPSLLKDICKIIFIHHKDKTVHYTSIPKNTIFMEDVDKCLEYLNPIVQAETKGYFQQVDETTEKNMRNPEFRSALIAFFYLEGLWKASLFTHSPFFNGDGTISQNVPFMAFRNVRVVVQNGKLKARVNYVAKTLRDVVCFAMTTDMEEGIYEQSLVLVPEVNLKYRSEETDGLNTKVINFRYIHNEDGFKAIGMISKDSCDGGGEPRPRKKFVLDKPFKITVFYKSEKILKVAVDNLK